MALPLSGYRKVTAVKNKSRNRHWWL